MNANDNGIRYLVQLDGEDDVFEIEAQSLMDAALSFAERADMSGNTTVVVTDCETGCAFCFNIELDRVNTAA